MLFEDQLEVEPSTECSDSQEPPVEDEEDRNKDESEEADLVHQATMMEEPRLCFNWNAHRHKLWYTNTFRSSHHMSEEMFDILVDLLYNELTVICDTVHAKGFWPERPVAVSPEIIVSIGLSFMKGTQDQRRDALIQAQIYRLNESSAKRIIDLFMGALMACPMLDVRLPVTSRKIHNAVERMVKSLK